MFMQEALILCHPDFIPPKGATYSSSHAAAWKTEYDVGRALKKLDIAFRYLPITNSLSPIEAAVLKSTNPIVFNLLEEFSSSPELEFHVVNYLEQKQIPYTGCGSRTLLLCRRKAATKWILKHKKVFRLKEDLGTEPKFWYFMD